MKKTSSKPLFQFAILFALPALLWACSSPGGGFPQVASPPPFDYADGAELRSGMHRLAYASQRLDSALLMQDARDESVRLSVVNSLRDIQRIAAELERGDLSSTHRWLRSDMQNFESMITRAIREAEGNPPNFAAAGRVTGSCVNCHRSVQ